MTLPRLRALEILHVRDDNDHPAYLVRDPQGFSNEELVLSDAALFLAAHCDGEHDLDAALSAFNTRFGRTPERDEVEALIQTFQDAHFVEGDAFDAHAAALVSAFRAAPVREPAHAGVSYPADPVEAGEVVGGFFTAANESGKDDPERPGPLRGLIAPHIDLRVGGPCTARAYRQLRDAPEVTTAIVLGTAHAAPDPGWIVLDRPYATPLGEVPVDEALAQRLAAAAPTSDAEVFLHRREHSVEFQALFLAALRAGGRDLRMVPVLCGSLRTNTEPGGDPFLDELRSVLAEEGDRVVVIAGADLAHVGPRFGDPDPLDDEHLQLLERKDRATLDVAAKGDAAGFFASVTDSGDPRRICGLSPVFALLHALPRGINGHVLEYEQATDPTGTVTYASAAFHG